MTNYKTQHKEVLKKILQQNSSLSAEQIQQILQQQNFHMSTSTLYRNLTNLTKQNIISKKINSQGITEFILNQPSCPDHLHASCDRCKTVFHLPSFEMQKLKNHFNLYYNFLVSPSKTHISGFCKKCRKETKSCA